MYHVGRRGVINPQYLIQATKADRSVKKLTKRVILDRYREWSAQKTTLFSTAST